MKQETLNELSAIIRRLNIIIAENTKIVHNRPLNTELADKIIVHTAAHYGFTHEQILTKDRYESVAYARFVCIWMVHKIIKPKLSLQQIAKIFNRTSHKSIKYAIHSVFYKSSPSEFKSIIALEEKIRLALNIQHKISNDQPILPAQLDNI